MTAKKITFKDTYNTDITVHYWIPTGKPIGIMFLIHGITEHGLCNEPFTTKLVKENYIVYSIDHRGHGETSSETGLGTLGATHHFSILVENVNQAKAIILKNHPNLPLYVLGHSMGSFIAQAAVQADSNHIKALLISGTTYEPKPLLLLGKKVVKFFKLLHGFEGKSLLFKLIVFAPYILKFIPFRTPADWICSDETVVDNYLNDPLCNFVPSVAFLNALFDLLLTIYTDENIQRVPSHLPLYFFSGLDDPLSKNGKAIKKVVSLYKKNGHQNIQVHLYKSSRHKILQEKNKEEVYQDIFNWLKRV